MSKARAGKNAPQDDFGSSVVAQLQAELGQNSAEDEGSDVTVLWCGGKRSGKTSLVDRFINPAKDEKEQPKPTVALDYKFVRYASEASSSKVLAHIYDLGGDESNDDLVSIPVCSGTVCNLVAAVVVDLAEPFTVGPALEKWLSLLRAQASLSLNTLAQESEVGAKRVETFNVARGEAFTDHPDAGSMNLFPVQLVIFATKWDTFTSEYDPEKRKSMARALRYFAHSSGASLVCTSLHDKGAMNNMRGVLRNLLFGAQVKGNMEQTDPNKPLCVFAGKDSLQNIGPAGGGSGDKAWLALLGDMFPDPNRLSKEPKKSDGAQVAEDITKYPESSVDNMIEQRLEELAQYRKQVERNQRLASEGIDGRSGYNF